MFLVVVTVDKQTGNIIGRPEIVTRGFVAGPDDPVIAGGGRSHRCARSRTPAITPASPACSRHRSRTASRSTCTTAPSAGRWSSRSWSRSRRAHGDAHHAPHNDHAIALARQEADDRPDRRAQHERAAARGTLADRPVRSSCSARSRSLRCSSRRPACSTATSTTSCGPPSARARGCWPVLLIVAGIVIERPPAAGLWLDADDHRRAPRVRCRPGHDPPGLGPRQHGRGAARRRRVRWARCSRARLSDARVVNRRLRGPARPDRGRADADVQHVAAHAAQPGHGRRADARGAVASAARAMRRRRAGRRDRGSSRETTPDDRCARAAAASAPSRSTPGAARAARRRSRTSAPLSQTIWTGRRVERRRRPAPATRHGAGRRARGNRHRRRPQPSRRASGTCRATSCSTPSQIGGRGQHLDHARNIRIIEEKLASFQIPASVTATNTGPVVTQYEVKPDARVKLSRIEGLADDLAMALAARSIRIEAPIPGRDVVGIEIPNHSSEIVGFRPAARGREHERRREQADLCPRPRRQRQGLRGRPRAHAAPAHRRRHRLGQERVRQRADHEHPDARHAGRGAPGARRPQARRARRLSRPAASRDAGDRRVARRARRADQPRARHGGALRAAGQRHGAQHRRLQRQRRADRASRCRTWSWSSTSSPT